MQARHGSEFRGLDVPGGATPPTGRFDRLFPTVDPRPPAGLAMAKKFGLPVTGLMSGGETTLPPAQDIARKIGS